MKILVVARKNVIDVRKFETITEAYQYYLKHFATIGDYAYYLKVAHCLLNRVHDEEIMESIFRNVFDNRTHLIIEGA